ncbi:MAG TPA: acyl-ACP--UDP-N-acetylglucosamine O-acyltransferase [Phycisphaerae bacterium]|mgnify:FL=1|nr:acyl-ACP--UDP-N-acetylglucosamine O-acyltransferase [Phycisphaerae bacterium]HQL71544.1 acyl-ACP--UDP-N-acetylglucosamine O-acyltransferase [Phycisphaerae bacterium]
MPKIHPTAIVEASAELADGVEIGPYAIVEADVRIGEGTRLAAHAVVRRHTTLGRNNYVDSGAVLGGLPQDLKFTPETVSYLRIGDGNVFREGVTISRATGEGNATVVGNRCYWMADTHAGHNATIEDDVVLVNGSAIAGHATVMRGVLLSAHAVVHQFCWVGERAMIQGNGGVSTHVPPYSLMAFGINKLAGLNLVGLRRAPDLNDQDRRQIKEAFRLLYRSGLTHAQALREMEARDDWTPPARRYVDFVRRATQADKPFKRGLPALRKRRRSTADPEE